MPLSSQLLRLVQPFMNILYGDQRIVQLRVEECLLFQKSNVCLLILQSCDSVLVGFSLSNNIAGELPGAFNICLEGLRMAHPCIYVGGTITADLPDLGLGEAVLAAVSPDWADIILRELFLHCSELCKLPGV